MNGILKDQPGVKTWFTLGGLSLLEGSQSSNAATMFIGLKDWEERTTPEVQQMALIRQISAKFGRIKDAFILVIPRPRFRVSARAVDSRCRWKIEAARDWFNCKLQ